MQVRITNVTDGPGKKPREVRIYTKKLRPGAWMDVPIQFVDDKVRKVEQTGDIVIGKLPSWYSDYESRRKVRNLTPEEVAANVQVKKDHQKAVAARKAAKEKPPVPVPASPETVPLTKKPSFTDTAPEPISEVVIENDESKEKAKEDGRGPRHRR